MLQCSQDQRKSNNKVLLYDHTKYNPPTRELVFSFKLKFLALKDAHMQGGQMSSGKKETDYEATESAQGSKQKS